MTKRPAAVGSILRVVVGIVIGVCLTCASTVLSWRLLVPPGEAQAVAILRHLNEVVARGGARDMQALFPEGYFFTHILTGLSWVEVGRAKDRDDPLRGTALRRARAALAAATNAEGRAPFPPSLPPDHGPFYAGWTTWLRVGVVELGGTEAERRALRSACASIAMAYRRSEQPFLPSYLGQAWPVDSVVAVSVLARCQQLTGVDHRQTIGRWLEQAGAKRRVFLPHTSDPATGAPLSEPRATSTVISLRFLHEIAPAWSSRMYAAFRKRMVVTRLGSPAVREHLNGVGGGDVDSGPLIAGVSLSASAVAAGVARVHGDDDLADSILSVGEVLGVPIEWNGSRRYLLGALPVADAFEAWALTASQQVSVHDAKRWDPLLSWGWRLPWLLLFLAPTVAWWGAWLWRIRRRR